MITSGYAWEHLQEQHADLDRPEFRAIGDLILEVLDGLSSGGEKSNQIAEESVRQRVNALCMRFPIYSKDI